tara:strand:+ start:84544 stop:86181 length:1638 start_codon:yes stop_codon:yes gene_type:complete
MKYRLQRNFISWLVFHTFEYWYYYLGAIASLYFLHFYQSRIPEMAKELGDLATSNRLGEVDIVDFLLLAFYILFFRTFSRLLFFYPARVQQKNLRIEVMHRLERVLPENYKDLSDGDLFQRIVTDFNRIRGFMGFALLQFGNIIIAAIIFIPKINEFNDKFLIAFSPLVLCVILFSILIYFFQPIVRKNMDAYAHVQNFMIESYDAKKSIKNFHSEKSFVDKFKTYSGLELHLFFISTLGRAFSFPLTKLGVGTSLIWGAYIVLENDLAGTDLIFFSGFLYLVLEPLLFLSWIGVVTSQGYAAWTRIKELVERTEKDVTKSWYQKELDITKFKVPFWQNEIELNLIPKNWNVFIGETGVGKSYLLEKLAEQLHFSKISYSYIQQEPYLYNDSIFNNIFLGNDSSPEKMKLVKKCLVDFGLDILGPSLEDVLKLEVGENGKQVSGGQAKRIALIRSLVSDVDFILWDDPFSSVDLILEREIIKHLKQDPLLEGKTFILTSHRISTVRAADWIILLEKEKGVIEALKSQDAFNEGNRVNEFFNKQMV